MTSAQAGYEAIIIGGGFYGVVIALYLKQQRGFKNVLIIEKESQLLSRASYNNQARVHNGYHYPRSFTTAYRSRINLPRFLADWPSSIKRDFVKIYAIARQNSKVTTRQFERFCREIGASIEDIPLSLKSIFEPKLIEGAFLVEEYAFDTSQLKKWAVRELLNNGIEVQYDTTAVAIEKTPAPRVITNNKKKVLRRIDCRYVFNCTYSGLNQLKGDFPGISACIKHEITEMALISPPPELNGFGITVMDGPFFSYMPFPARELYTLSHVRYTPHMSWIEEGDTDPYLRLGQYQGISRVDRMLRDVSRYIPKMATAKYADSLWETKSVLVKNEGDDGRPILFEKHPATPFVYSILGGKIDNVYDILAKLDSEPLQTNSHEIKDQQQQASS